LDKDFYMEALRSMLLALDPYLIWSFRLVQDPWISFFLGMIFLNLVCVIMGDISSLLVRRMNRKIYGKYHDQMVRHHNLSVEALKHSDKEAYKAVNRQAHEAFGKYFFSQAGAFTLSIWPLPFALAWMELRFGGLPLTLPFSVPGVGDTVLYPFFFIPLYIAVRILYGRIMRLVPFYQRIVNWAKHGDGTQMVSFAELFKPAPETIGQPAGKKDDPPSRSGREERP
jgi:hypothetical protein